MMRVRKSASCFALAAAMATSSCSAQTQAVESHEMMSAGAITFDDADTLFVGDSKQGVVHAFSLDTASLEDQSGVSFGRAETFEGTSLIDGLDLAMGTLFGTAPDEIVINDMVVHDRTKQIFLSVHQGRGPDARPAIVKVNDGTLEVVELAEVDHSAMAIDDIPTTQTLEFGQSQNSFAITDIDFFDGEVFVAGLSNGTFASKLRRFSYPFTEGVSETSIEIWHAVHAQFETRAPIIAQDIRVLDGEPTLIAVYACTPLVRIPISALEDGAKIRGEMIGELGFGNSPIDIVSYRDPSDGNDYVVVTNTNRSASRVALADIAAAEPMPVNSPNNFGPAGVSQFPIPVSDAMHMDLLDEQWVVLIRRDPKNLKRTELHTLPLPFFFDRADHVVEMNWPGGPDPFGYRQNDGDNG